MFTKKVTDDDRFSNLSSSAQALYLHLTMSADDDGFCNQVSTAMFKAHASVQDLEALLAARYLLQFDSGVIVIKHWRMANALRKDRYTPTAFQDELAKLQIKENGSYTERKDDGCRLVASWLPDGCQVVATDKDRLDKSSLGEIREEQNSPLQMCRKEGGMGEEKQADIGKLDFSTPFPQVYQQPTESEFEAMREAALKKLEGRA